MAETDKERSERERNSWQYRALINTNGLLRLILIAALGKQRRTDPQLVGNATITVDGIVLCDCIQGGVMHFGTIVCDVADLVRNFRGLADHLRLNDAERVEMFDKIRNWCATDHRAQKGLEIGPAVKPWQ